MPRGLAMLQFRNLSPKLRKLINYTFDSEGKYDSRLYCLHTQEPGNYHFFFFVSLDQTGHVYTVSRSDIFPIARILIPSKFASILVDKYCEIDGYFSQPSGASSTPPAKKSARKSKSSRKKHKLDQYVVFDLPVDPNSADQCSVCTYDLKDEGMFDDGSEVRTLR